MSASDRSAVRRTGRILTGFGALVVLCALVVGAPIALLAFAGNPLPDHLPTLAEVGTALTSRDDGQLFLRALALAGWFGWATFTFSVLVELGAQSLRRPAPKLPGMSRQQKAAAALVGSVALILAASPAAASAAAVYAGPAYAGSATSVASAAAPPATTGSGSLAAAGSSSLTAAGSGPLAVAGGGRVGVAGNGPLGLAGTGGAGAGDQAEPVYRVARGDYLGEVAERYLDEFADYRQLAALNRLDDPDRIRPGQLLRLPAEAADQGARPHATGKLVGRPAAPKPPAPRPAPEQAAPERADTAPERAETAPRSGTESKGQAPTMTVGAARAGATDRVNRPLAVSAVLAVASIVGAQIGAVLGLRRRPATAGATPRLSTASRAPRRGGARSGAASGAARSGAASSSSAGDRAASSGTARGDMAGSSAGRRSGAARSSGTALAASRARAAIGATAPPPQGTVPASAAGWPGDGTASAGSGGGTAGGGSSTGGSGGGGTSSGGDGGLDFLPDVPSPGRHRRG
ncbi:LysM peptidoglycan-binding domain-containing protein [Micromonospora sp. NPDC000316]|uniref:LysM peptidoglycan-binding domain-containing protein n=1 Tax=Micromonospora sp. NPDC000316 TaxID=3364216 RepID=UPI00367DC11D